MISKSLRSKLIWTGFALSSCSLTAAAHSPVTEDERTFFEQRIRPVLVAHCYTCHSSQASSPASDYLLDTPRGLLAGGASGEPAVVPGKPAASRLLRALRHKGPKMPPQEKLSDEIVRDFAAWIAMGAPDPRETGAEGIRQDGTSQRLWSLQKPVKHSPPPVTRHDWPHTSIDRFVLARLEEQGLHPVGDAHPRELIRRVFFDLIGLPPGPAEVSAYLHDPSTTAFEKVVDSLLDSPRFGERWGRHWLDVARYAESSGMEFNFTYPHAWPYRDYVIKAFNKDKPYDRFVTEQLAGDLLPADTPQQRDENRLATGFLAIGPKRHNAGKSIFRADMVDDQIRATSEAFLGLTAGCARCHDHKFDPIPTDDYYALAGIFMSTDTLYGTTEVQHSRHPSPLIAWGPDAESLHEQYDAHQMTLQEAQEQLSQAEEQLKKLKEKMKKEGPGKENEKDEQATPQDSDGKAKDPLIEVKLKVQRLQQRVEKRKNSSPQPPKYAMGVREGQPTNAHVAVGGDPGNKGGKVPRGFLSSVAVDDCPPIGTESSGRLALARWIADRTNPLTARVMVNRIWHHLFGRGIVSTVDNLGVLGNPPSHPKLLDHLAVTFMEDGWSVKRMIRSIVLSRTYQLSTGNNTDNAVIDAQNVYLWRMTPRRLEAEPLRDAMLTVSGELDLTPPAGSTVTPLGQQLARRVSNEKLNPTSKHRSVYLPVVRHYASHMFQEFDVASASLVVGNRAETTTAQQALFLLNNKFILDRAAATASLLLTRHPDDKTARVRRAFQRALCRPPTRAEMSQATQFLRDTEKQLERKVENARQRERLALASLVQMFFCSPEFRYLIHPPHDHATTALAANPQP